MAKGHDGYQHLTHHSRIKKNPSYSGACLNGNTKELNKTTPDMKLEELKHISLNLDEANNNILALIPFVKESMNITLILNNILQAQAETNKQLKKIAKALKAGKELEPAKKTTKKSAKKNPK